MSINKLLISGGCERNGGFELGDGKYYEKAVLAELDLESGKFEEVYCVREGGVNYPTEHPNIQFTAGCVQGDTLWLPTDTEIHELCSRNYQLVRTISHSCFQNLHSVHRLGEYLITTSTGLDNVIFLDAETGEISKIVNAEGKDPWHRFDRTIDYRQVHSTRPYNSHTNYVFVLKDTLWVTRCTQEDAVNMSNFNERLDITRGSGCSVHDGVVWKDRLIFTRVDGLLPMFDTASGSFLGNEDPFRNHVNKPIGWCRGLLVENDVAYLGFSRIRKTRMKHRLKFLAQRNLKYGTGQNALVVAYDLKNQSLLNVYEAPAGLIDAIYGVMAI